METMCLNRAPYLLANLCQTAEPETLLVLVPATPLLRDCKSLPAFCYQI